MAKNRLSDNVGGVKQFSRTLQRALGEERAISLSLMVCLFQPRLACNLSGQELSPTHASLRSATADHDFPHVHSDQGLDFALERMGTNRIEILPVVSRADVHKLEGVVTLRDVLDSYGVSRPDRA